MAAADLIAIADAAVTALNGHTFSAPYDGPLNAARVYDLEEDFSKLDGLRASVLPRGSNLGTAAGGNAGAPLARGRQRLADSVITVVIQKRVKGLDPDDADELVLLSQEVRDFLFKTDLANLSPVPVGIAEDIVFDENRLAVYRDFESVFTVTYRAVR